MKKKTESLLSIIVLMACCAGLCASAHAQEKELSRSQIIKQLDPQYREWLDLVHYIITPVELDSFFKITNNRDREAFINLFWTLRDPTKGTPQNEYRDEHIKRYTHVNRYFKHGSPLPGWKTDRGRIYMLLGPPVAENEVEANGLRPVLIWDYYGGPKKGLPTAFNIVFYKKSGVGEYKLYVPVIDGPSALLRSEIGQVDSANYEQIYQKIHQIEPAVALIALSLVPGDQGSGFHPSMQDPILLSRISDLPKSNINATYAKHFLKFKGLVETSVTTNYIDIKNDTFIIRDPTLGLNFVHFALQPERISVDYSESDGKYYFNFDLLVILKQKEETVIQYEKKFPFYYTKEELDSKLSNGLILTDYFPVIEGRFRMIILLQNSLNKEVSYFEKELHIPAAESGKARIGDPIIAYQVDPAERQVYGAFYIMGQIVKIDPARIFGMKDAVSAIFTADKNGYSKAIFLKMELSSTDETRPFFQNYKLEFPEGKNAWTFVQALGKLNYGNYSLEVKVMDAAAGVLDKKVAEFQVSPLSGVTHPPLAAKLIQAENKYVFYQTVATQHQNTGNFEQAESYYRKALALNPSWPPAIKSCCGLLLERKKYKEALELAENLKSNQSEAFDYFTIKGKALYYLQDYNAAVGALLEANKAYDSDITVINTLALALLRINEKTEAAKALTASLKINPDQKDIAELLKKLSREMEPTHEKPKKTGK